MKKLLCMLMMVLAFSACSKEEKNEEILSRTEAYKKYNKEQMETTRTKIIYFSAPDETGAKEILVNDFNNLQEDIYVEIRYIGENATRRYTDVTSALSYGDTFDVFDSDFSHIKTYIEKQIPLNITDRAKEISLSNYYSNVANAVKSGNDIYALPNSINFALLYYRSDIVADIPANYAEFKHNVQNIKTDKAESNFVFAGKADSELYDYFAETISLYEGTLAEREAKVIAKSFADIYLSDTVPDSVKSMSQKDANEYFLEGKSAFLRGYPNVWSLVQKRGTNGINYAIANFPKVDDSQKAHITGQVTMINKNTEHPYASYRFLEYLCGIEGQKTMAINGSYPPSIKSLYVDRDVIAKNPHFGVENFTKNLESPIYTIKNVQENRIASERNVYDLVHGIISISTGVTEILSMTQLH